MAIKIAGSTVINNSRGVQNMGGIEGNYTNFHGVVTAIANNLDMSKPVMSRTLTAATTFTASNLATGKVCLLMLDIGSSQYIPTWPASIKWPGDGTEPDWDATGVTKWLVCLTCWDNTTIRATATGWGTGATQTASVDLGSAARSYTESQLWDETTSPHGKAVASMTFQPDGSVAYSSAGTTLSGAISGQGGATQLGTSSWGSAVTGSNYEVNFNYTLSLDSTTGGTIVTTAGDNTWLSLGSARQWKIQTGTSGDSIIELVGTVSIRNATTNAVLSSKAQTLRARFEGSGVGGENGGGF